MKKIIKFLVCAFLFIVLAAPVATFAISDNANSSSVKNNATITNTTTTNNQTTRQALITTLQTRITELKAQLDSLTAQLQTLQAQGENEIVDISGTFKILNQLRLGAKNDDVKKLQELLATDPSVYPSGLITGYYGKMTENAVKKLQKKLCLPEVGSVGPQTLWRVNELLDGLSPTGKIPAGLLTAPGIQKKLCSNTTPDNTTLAISGISKTKISATTVDIIWTTNKVADSKVWISTTSSVNTTGTPTAISSTSATSHEIQLTGLIPNTTYYFVVSSTDDSTTVKGAEGSFTTLTSDTTAPTISNIDELNITATTAKIEWTTNEVANSKIWYSTTPSINTSADPTMTSSTYVISHKLQLTGLTAGTTYYYVIGSADGTGNLGKSSEGSFVTTVQ